ncbi:hypothetical protein I79_002932 [Cricetulus griseus]|uniref:Uncharacterized protein n=1 Tax=Cricetulus griseus TaxID=10029 RepID=G3GYM7_CRIGR|nr:hypothetical protein I79_002932 [Cricetulus griseus]
MESLVTSVLFLQQAFTDHPLSTRHHGGYWASKDKPTPYKALTKGLEKWLIG